MPVRRERTMYGGLCKAVMLIENRRARLLARALQADRATLNALTTTAMADITRIKEKHLDPTRVIDIEQLGDGKWRVPTWVEDTEVADDVASLIKVGASESYDVT
eukprot:3057608-Pleurochrysis_carterae.AAC.1